MIHVRLAMPRPGSLRVVAVLAVCCVLAAAAITRMPGFVSGQPTGAALLAWGRP